MRLSIKLALRKNINSGIETADSADFTEFEAVIGDERTNLFVAKLQGIDKCNLLDPCNLRHLRFNRFGFWVKSKRLS